MEQQTPARKQLVRDAKREALTRMEDAARTTEDFVKVVKQWDHLDENRERRERDHESLSTQPLLEWSAATFDSAIIPQPFGHAFWRQLLGGNFLDVIFDCPHELHEQTSSPTMSNLLKTLKENQIEIMYYWVIRQYSPQRIAKLRGQTDRNIRKGYDKLITGLRDKLHFWLSPRYDAGLPLTLAQKEFMKNYRAGIFKTKTALDKKSGE